MYTTKTHTVDQIMKNPNLMHKAERAALLHLHNLNLEGTDEDFIDIDEFEELETAGEEEFFLSHCDSFDPYFD